ncbi:hypothetical protein V5P93_005159 [Actinokineospora auranticolor]|uniref:Nucleotidyltransferase AbiEii toxin of type IV toxin-antitoxin system n=1 Tax=Actinokineospora auranticolor TaxID=155976 RepID=A0A2S6GKG1_9PSEU|nr:hypothetical protein [Actinokineospora auranticolor]PPK65690.1 hypothetical protein CLV40_113174 [Actinokineospora auranticolor]
MSRPELRTHPLLRRLADLALPDADHAIFGSGPLLAWGIRDAIGDLDVIARGAAWQRAAALAEPAGASSGTGLVVRPPGSAIEIFDRWLDPVFDTDELIDSADLIDGFRFVALDKVYAWKRASDRPKDKVDADLIARFLHSCPS